MQLAQVAIHDALPLEDVVAIVLLLIFNFVLSTFTAVLTKLLLMLTSHFPLFFANLRTTGELRSSEY